MRIEQDGKVYEPTGEVRAPRDKEFVLGDDGKIYRQGYTYVAFGEIPIYREVAPSTEEQPRRISLQEARKTIRQIAEDAQRERIRLLEEEAARTPSHDTGGGSIENEEITDAHVEAVEEAVGMGAAAWDCICNVARKRRLCCVMAWRCIRNNLECNPGKTPTCV